MKVCIAASAGGHLTEVMQVRGAWKGLDHFFVSDSRENALELAKKEKVFFVTCPRRSPVRLAQSLLQSWRIFAREKPDVVISTGADTAISLCLIAKLFGKKIIFIESYARISSPSISGKIMYPLADVFLVQWKQNLSFFSKAVYAGSVF